MNAEAVRTIGLMGQPNTGKSTVFNVLTGARQHVGNWPGKTVERKEGVFTAGSIQYRLIDLPGTYSLLANSDEEVITRDAVMDDSIGVVLAILDASQLTRSMYLLSDYAGIEKPVIVLLNMADVAAEQGKSIDAHKMSELLGVPVLPVTAVRKNGLAPLADLLASGKITGGRIRTDGLESSYHEAFGENWDRLTKILPETPGRSRFWTAAKLIEGDGEIAAIVRKAADADWAEIKSLCVGQKDGLLTSSDCKFRWISGIVEQAVKAGANARLRRSRFDSLATAPFWGKLIATGILLGGFILSILVGFSLMGVMGAIRAVATSELRAGLEAIDVNSALISLICDAILGGVFIALDMVCYVFAVSLVFGYMEEVGYMARISYVFDSAMQRLRLHGKAVMPFVVNLGCTIGGVAGSRVIDSWKQRLLTIAVSWVVPCIPVWAVVGVIGTIFFGFNVVWIVIAMFATAALHMFVTSRIFGRSLSSPEERTGLIMELPPYHKPNKKMLLRFVWHRMKDVLFRATKLITLVSVVFWLLSYSSNGDITSTVLYKAGTFIEPATLFFGLSWELFAAFLVSSFGKEASLGAISALFNTAGGTVNLVGIGLAKDSTTPLAATLLARVSLPQALAFLFGVFFTFPCVAALGATAAETHSMKWTVRIALYYIVVAFLVMGIAYRVGLMIF
jgi:ferrous iron transport protein B